MAESSERTSTRAELGLPYAGTRTRAERLRWPQQTYAGASVIRSGSACGNSRLYELTHWLVTAVYSRACTSRPAMNAWPTLDSFIGSPASWNALRSPSNSDRCVCMPLPGWSVNGFGMKVACTPVRERHLLDHVPEGHDVVGRGQRVGVAQVDLLLAGRDLVVAELDRDADPLQREHGLAAEVAGDRVGGVVEVAAGVDRGRHASRPAGRPRSRKNSISGWV